MIMSQLPEHHTQVGPGWEKILTDLHANLLRAKVRAANPIEAELIACQVAACTSVMPVWSDVEEWS